MLKKVKEFFTSKNEHGSRVAIVVFIGLFFYARCQNIMDDLVSNNPYFNAFLFAVGFTMIYFVLWFVIHYIADYYVEVKDKYLTWYNEDFPRTKLDRDYLFYILRKAHNEKLLTDDEFNTLSESFHSRESIKSQQEMYAKYGDLDLYKKMRNNDNPPTI